MIAYAQTNLQLFKQLQDSEYSPAELGCIRDGYQLAMELFTGLFRPSGKVFIEHLVGVASILCSLHARIELIAAGLLHAAYIHGDYGSIPPPLAEKRRRVANAVGSGAEEYIFRYTNFAWGTLVIRRIRQQLNDPMEIDREVVLLRLANELEDNLDLGLAYCPDSETRRRNLDICDNLMVEIARGLAQPELALVMERTFRDTLSLEAPDEFRNVTKHKDAFLIAPKSYSRKTANLVRHILMGQLSQSSVGLDLARRLRAMVDRTSFSTSLISRART